MNLDPPPLFDSDPRLARAILDTAGAVVAVLDAQSRFRYVNRAFEELTGYSSAELDGRLLAQVGLLLEEELADVQALFAKRVTEGVTHHENHLMCRSGHVRLVSWSNTVLSDSDGQLAYVIGTGVEVTEQRRAEAALAASQERLTVVVQSAPVTLFALDARGIFMLAEGSRPSGTGLSNTDILGRSAFDLYAAHPEILAALRGAFAGEVTVSLLELEGIWHETRYTRLILEEAPSEGCPASRST